MKYVDYLERKLRQLEEAQYNDPRELMVERTIAEYDLTQPLAFCRLLVPASAIQKKRGEGAADGNEPGSDASFERPDTKTQGTGVSTGKPPEKLNAAPVGKPANKQRRPFRRCVRVFEPSEIARAKDIVKALPHETRDRVQAAVKVAAEHDGYRKVPSFKNIDRELSRMALQFANFQQVLDHYAEEMALAGACRVEAFHMSPVLLDGDPGVGKTAFAQAFAAMLGLPFCKMSAGGIQHAAALTGTASHWANAQPGEVFNLIARSQLATGVLLIDEADKLSDRQDSSILPALLDLLEPETARNYKDESLGLKFDASRLIVLMTSNAMSSMHAALLSRCRTFTIKAPGIEQRVQIAMGVHDEINRALPRDNRIGIDCRALEQLSGADIDIRALIMAVRAACSKALRTGSRTAKPEMPQERVIRRQIGFVQTAHATADG